MLELLIEGRRAPIEFRRNDDEQELRSRPIEEVDNRGPADAPGLAGRQAEFDDPLFGEQGQVRAGSRQLRPVEVRGADEDVARGKSFAPGDSPDRIERLVDEQWLIAGYEVAVRQFVVQVPGELLRLDFQWNPAGALIRSVVVGDQSLVQRIGERFPVVIADAALGNGRI